MVEAQYTKGATMVVHAYVIKVGVVAGECSTDGRKAGAVLNCLLGLVFKRSEAGIFAGISTRFCYERLGTNNGERVSTPKQYEGHHGVKIVGQ